MKKLQCVATKIFALSESIRIGEVSYLNLTRAIFMFYSIRVMQKVLFIITHLGSGSFELFNSLIKVPSIDGFKMDISYRHPDDLKLLTKNIHKKNDASAIYMDELLYNHSLLSKKLEKI